MLRAGIDEVGRGCLAGPLVAACLVFHAPQELWPVGIRDSKALSPKKRQKFFQQIMCVAYCGVGWVFPAEIDRINILEATHLGMRRAYFALTPFLQEDVHVLVDGQTCPNIPPVCDAIIRGDQTIVEISAASIIAKVVRDSWMIEVADIFPGYDFHNNKGYGTSAHLKALEILGPTWLHRFSFAPLKNNCKHNKDF